MKTFSSKHAHNLIGRLGLAAIVSMVALPAGAQDAKPPVAGPSSIQEVYQDWTVNCVVQQTGRQCAIIQRQNQRDSNQLVIAAELTVAKDDASTGVLLLPFGLSVVQGVTLQVDDKPVSKPFAFQTCLPNGCVVPINLDKAMMTTARAGTTLKVSAPAVNANQPLVFNLSLKGFGQAYDRLKALLAG